jgi:3-hydroxymyristoyl/3-hydroxydecanoyl-(acyl carrier protein) dehydratase
VALDPHEGAGLEALARSVAKLWSAGVQMDLAGFTARLTELREGGRPLPEPEGMVLRLAAHSPDVVWPDSFAPDGLDPRHEAGEGPPVAPSDPVAPSEKDTMNEHIHEEVMAPPPASGFGYDVSRHFRVGAHRDASEAAPGSSVVAPTGEGSDEVVAANGTRASSGAPAASGHPTHPALDLFDAVARAHAEFLREQKETHEAFLALGLDVGGAHGVVAPAPAPSSARATDHAVREAVEPVAAPPSRRPDRAPEVAPAGRAARTAPPSGAAPGAEATSRPSAAPRPGTSDGPPSPVIPIAPPIDRDALPATPFLTRQQLEVHAGGVISKIFGEQFAQQDGYARQVRMPEPPLLFADRALTIEGEPGSMKKGRVVTETDVRPDAWYLHTGRMAPGVVIESGQADLLLISWLGADFLNKGERVYRLLGCDLTFFGELPAPGETLTYDIHVDGHAKTGDVRLFFFHYDCYIGDRLLISVRNGQAGFFTDEELAGSGGVLWKAEDDEPDPDARLDPAPRMSTKRSFSREEVRHWVDGDAYRCFGDGFELAASHTRTPNTPGGRLRLLDHVPVFDPQGGPWGRGYLRAEAHVSTDAWFYDGHFNNDPCMPGTLMADAATQALSFAMAAMGFTIRRDGWRFEPVPGEMARFLCRGQVVPDGPHTLEYEIFIEEVVDGDVPEVYAALLCKSDGFKVFQCRRFGLRLVPDYPLTTRRGFLEGAEPPRLVGPGDSDVRGDYEALLSCAWGKPSDAFGKMFTKFDGALKCPRLPGPPYHFMSSIVSVDVAPGSASEGGTLVSTFDVDPDAWYFDEGQGNMPFAVLVEALLQPCGWFASYLNFFADTDGDVAFRNLDGEDCILHKPIPPDIGTLELTTHLTRSAKAAGTSIVFFEVTCEDDEGPVMTLTTDFGFFSPKVLEAQRGLPTTDEMRARRDAPSPTPPISLLEGGGQLAHLPGMKSGKMRMLDEVTGFWPEGGDAGLGRIRTYQKIHVDSWYFKAHFYEDPVQPGSLGLDALVQSARALVELKGWLAELDYPVWEHPIVDFPLAWRYRGQVVPLNDEVVTEVEALEVERVAGESLTLKVYGTQWVDGLRIYEVPSFAIRVRARGE